MEKNSKIYIAGHTGLVGSAIWRMLQSLGYDNLIGKTKDEIDLTNQAQTDCFFATEKPEYVFDAAAKVGGIMANNNYRAEFIYNNLMMENNIIHAAYVHNVKKLLFLGSTCIYPRNAPQPMKEEYLLTGLLEPTNEPYAIAKIAGIKMCESYWRQYGCDFISVMPTNLYGPGDNFDLRTSHVLPALIRRIYDAKHNDAPSITLWGTGKVFREFMYVDDMADACVWVMNNVSSDNLYNEKGLTHINLGTEEEITIFQLAVMIKEITGYKGELEFDRTHPDGPKRKLTDCSLIHRLGWYHKTGLKEGLLKTWEWYKNIKDNDIDDQLL